MPKMLKEAINIIKHRLLKLEALEISGVDNWSGHDYAMEVYQKLLKEAGLDD